MQLGNFDSLECPECHNWSVSVRFTHPRQDAYRTWFVCSKCPFRLRLQNSGRPTHFSEDRIDELLQAYDVDILTKCKFPLPKEPGEPKFGRE